MEKLLAKRVTKVLKKHGKVLVFTQDEDEIRRFLIEEPGRWNVEINEIYWDKSVFRNQLSCEGNLCEGYKFAIGDNLLCLDGGKVGLDKNSDVIFSKNPFRKITEKTFIIKDLISFPRIRREDHLPPILAIRKEGTPIVFKCDGIASYHALHDQFTMQGIDHSVFTSGEVKPIHLTWKCLYGTKADKVVVYGLTPIHELAAFNDCRELIIVRPTEVVSAAQPGQIKAISRCFADTPTMALTADYIAFKTFLHPSSVKKALFFMHRAGSVVRVRKEESRIIIHKTGPMPKEIEYHSIPEGTYSISALVKHLRIQREGLFDLLKKYEGKGLVFSYAPTKAQTLWLWKKAVEDNQYETTLSEIQQEETLLTAMESGDDMILNVMLEDRIQKHCLGSGTEAEFVMFDQIIAISPRPHKFEGGE